MLAARIDGLGGSEKQVLQAASVIGKEFPEAPPVADERARLAAIGDGTQQARAKLMQALDLYREVGATGHVQRLSEELGV